MESRFFHVPRRRSSRVSLYITNRHDLLRKLLIGVGLLRDRFKEIVPKMKRGGQVGYGPLTVTVVNEGLGWDSLLKM